MRLASHSRPVPTATNSFKDISAAGQERGVARPAAGARPVGGFFLSISDIRAARGVCGSETALSYFKYGSHARANCRKTRGARYGYCHGREEAHEGTPRRRPPPKKSSIAQDTLRGGAAGDKR
jgi:hypothetical protein